MKEWYSLAEIAAAALPDLPPKESSLDNFARCNWRGRSDLIRSVAGKTKPITQYHVSLLPQTAQAKLAYLQAEATADDETRSKMLWSRFEGLSSAHKDACRTRLQLLVDVEAMAESGIRIGDAVRFCIRKADIGLRTYYEWREMVEGWPRADWLAALAPSFSPATNGVEAAFADCHPMAWSALKSDYLRPEAPKFSPCYRRVVAAAKKHGWTPIPTERSLRRRMEAEVPKAVRIMTREGKEATKKLFPAQRRSRSMLHAMEAVNMDGHKLDLFVRVPWLKMPARVILLAIQDLYSGKIVSWRIAEAETWEAVRLVIGDMIELYGIPEKITLDNGRAFASKKITGGATTRYRFKIRPEDPQGLLTTLKVDTHWTIPRSGQSKPIERAWGDLAENICKHPRMSGAYTGNNPMAKPENYGNSAVPLEELQAHVAEMIEEHNARDGRKAKTAGGRSFDTVFAASMADPSTIVRVASPSQRSLWLLSSEAITASKGDGHIAFMGNRYWNVALNSWAGKKVTIRFDPDNLHKPIKVYDLKDRLICDADCIADVGFYSQDDGRKQQRLSKQHTKAIQQVAEAHRQLTAAQLGEIYSRGDKAQSAPTPIRPAVTRLASGNLAMAPVADAISDVETQSSFSRAMGMIQGGAVIPFPQQGNGPKGPSNEPKSNAYGSGKKKGGKNPAR